MTGKRCVRSWNQWKFTEESEDKMLELHDVNWMPTELIGERFGLSRAQVAHQIRNARKRLERATRKARREAGA
jgi:DNA-directed RNA polymerase specialized sigma24 family protein